MHDCTMELLAWLLTWHVHSALAEGQKDEFSTTVTYNNKHKTVVADLTIIRYF